MTTRSEWEEKYLGGFAAGYPVESDAREDQCEVVGIDRYKMRCPNKQAFMVKMPSGNICFVCARCGENARMGAFGKCEITKMDPVI